MATAAPVLDQAGPEAATVAQDANDAATSQTPVTNQSSFPAPHEYLDKMCSLDKALLWIVTGLLISAMVIMIWCVGAQSAKYEAGMRVALGMPYDATAAHKLSMLLDVQTATATTAATDPANSSMLIPPDHAASLAYARALDLVMIKTLALMLAFITVFLGALYVLRTAGAAYQAAISGGGYSGSLQTSSPGLVMVTLGTAVVAAALLIKGNVNYKAPQATPVTAAAPAQDQAAAAPQAPQSSSAVSPPAENTLSFKK